MGKDSLLNFFDENALEHVRFMALQAADKLKQKNKVGLLSDVVAVEDLL